MAGTRLRTSYRHRPAILATAGLLLLAALGIILWEAFRSDVRIAGQVDWPYGQVDPIGQKPQVEVIRSQRNFIDASGMAPDGKTRMTLEKLLTDAFGIKAVNFHRQMLLVVRAGVQPTGGYDVVVTRVVFDNDRKALMVHWTLRPRAPGQPVAWRPNYPAALVLLKRFDGDVILDPVPDP